MVDGMMKINVGGEDVQLLVTPRLCIYNGRENVSLASDVHLDDAMAEGALGFSLGADVIYCAALNYWDLTGRDVDDFPLHRIDFHRWAFEQKSEYVKVARKALMMLNGGKAAPAGEDSKKK